MRYGKWETVRELGKGGQGTANLAVNTELLDPEILLSKVKRAVGDLAVGGGVEDNRKNAQLLLDLIDVHLRREAPDVAAVVKVLHEPGRSDRKALARLDQEVDVLRRVRHAGLISVIGASVRDGWFVTPYYPNGTLAKNLQLFAGDPVRALGAFRGLVEGVAAVHGLAAVHRDIKPENIFTGPSGLVLGDFGIVHFEDEGKTRISDTYENVGSKDWMPGWAIGKRLDEVRPSFDVFTLGKVLWAMVSGGTKLRLWYYDKDEFNIERRFPNDERMRWINRLLSGSVREHEGDVWGSAEELLARVDAVATILRRGGQIINRDVPRNCFVCGSGTYQAVVDETSGSAATRNFGLDPRGEQFRIFACNHCGNIQWFRMTMNPRRWGEV